MEKKLEALRKYLESLPSGKIEKGQDVFKVKHYISNCWDIFKYSDGKNINSVINNKPIYNVVWNPPVIKFKIPEYYNNRSTTRVDCEEWHLDLDTKIAKCYIGGYIQLLPKKPRLNVKPIAEELVPIIINRKEDPRIEWKKDGSVRIKLGEIITSDRQFNRTVQDRRKRFKAELNRLLEEQGWHMLKPNHYAQNEK
ncbi:hypothetical protein [Fidelibacter multiformis]|uniref:hypothetical protein n=1 Tax=Fidelibacter multiformis TaxID=3377529 RepID=UPI0037DD6B5C